jgi:DNA sulfur modification protein DndD
MTLLSLSLKDIALYEGSHHFDLSIDGSQGKNIILFGGKNGSGKTTLLEAVKLCLFGKYALSGNVNYKSFILEKIRKGRKHAQIELEFTHSSLGTEHIYRIVRKWTFNKNLREDFLLYKNGKICTDIPKSQWQEFILTIVPPNLIDFFFFDGERIEHLAKDLSEAKFTEDIKLILGVTAIEHLQTGLYTLERRYLRREANTDSLLQELSKLETELESLRRSIDTTLLKLEEKRQALKQLEDELEVAEKAFRERGGEVFLNYDSLKEKEEILRKGIDEIKNEIRELSSKELPLGINISLIDKLIKQLRLEQQALRLQFEEQIIKEKFNKLVEVLNKNKISDTMLQEIKSICSVDNSLLSDVELIHKLPEEEVEQVVLLKSTLERYTLPRVQKLFSKLEQLENELVEVQSALQAAPDEDYVRPYWEQILKLREERVRCKLEIESLGNSLEDLRRKENILLKEILRLEEHLRKESKLTQVLNSIEKVREVLDLFKEQFVKRKIQILEKEILLSLQKLKRKTNFIKEVHIDPRTFELTLYDMNGNSIFVRQLSAGERQIFAIAFLWGLAKASGKKLPVIIDTPLGRLDSEHRERLAKYYFPYVSHQVVILSTDVEIDNRLFNILQPHISHTYHLVYEDHCVCTRVEKGYFWFN